MKNCGLRFHVKIAQRDFLNDLLRIIQPKVCTLPGLQLAGVTWRALGKCREHFLYIAYTLLMTVRLTHSF